MAAYNYNTPGSNRFQNGPPGSAQGRAVTNGQAKLSSIVGDSQRTPLLSGLTQPFPNTPSARMQPTSQDMQAHDMAQMPPLAPDMQSRDTFAMPPINPSSPWGSATTQKNDFAANPEKRMWNDFWKSLMSKEQLGLSSGGMGDSVVVPNSGPVGTQFQPTNYPY